MKHKGGASKHTMAGFVRGTPDTLVLNRMTGFDRKATTRAFCVFFAAGRDYRDRRDDFTRRPVMKQPIR